MKKGKFFLSLFLSVMLCFGAFSARIPAEEGGDDSWSEETEREYLDAYYEEIQSNNISGWPQGDPVQADAAILMDADTGAVLYAKDIDQVLYPASITKIMTTLLALENGDLSDTVKFSEYAVYSIEYGSSHLGLTEGEELTLEQCLYGIMLASANEISNAVAEHIGGDVTHFVEMMNERAAQLGCTHTHFVNPHGLHDEDHYTCAKDMALIMQEALKNPKFCEIIGTEEYFFPETNLVDEKRYFMNHHKMIAEEGMLYDGCIGGKNGFTDEAWNSLVTAAERDGQKLICVVLKVPGQYESYDDTRILLDYGFANFSNVQVSNSGSPDMEITGITDPAELEKIRNADILQKPFSMVGTTFVTLPEGVQESSLKKTLDFASDTLSYSYEGQVLGSVPFTYTGEWEIPDPVQTETQTEALTETETEKVESSSFVSSVKAFFGRAAEGAAGAFEGLNTFIDEHTIAAVAIGAVLLLLFVPLLLIAVNRQRKYRRIVELRNEDMKIRRRLESEIERKSAAQVEAELRAEALQAQLAEEKQKHVAREKKTAGPERTDGFYLDEESANEEDEEYIEVPIDEQ